MKRSRLLQAGVLVLASVTLLAGCRTEPPQALGTLERDRITLPAPAAERIAEIAVREGDTVKAGDVLLVLESERTRQRSNAALAEVARLEAVLLEARNGVRPERIEEMRQRLARAESLALNARRERERVDAVVARGLLPAADRDRARSASAAADADVRAGRAALAELEHGSRAETIAQAEAALAAARAQAATQAVDLERIRVSAPRAGLVDSLPFEVGDQVAVGTPLVVMLVGEHPHARVYVPQPLRLRLRVGSAARVILQHDETVLPGRVRTIRSEPVFTPYFALAGDDVAQLSYLAEIELDAAADALPVGLPLRVEFPEPAPP